MNGICKKKERKKGRKKNVKPLPFTDDGSLSMTNKKLRAF
jgi:hypothetical protein